MFLLFNMIIQEKEKKKKEKKKGDCGNDIIIFVYKHVWPDAAYMFDRLSE